MCHKFEAPDPDSFTEEFGAAVVRDSEDDVYLIDFAEVTGQDLTFSYNVTAGSVRVQLRDAQDVVVDVFREGATRLRIASDKTQSSLMVDFDAGEFCGSLCVQIFPRAKITDRLLVR
ncbi:hypothetical protein GCM10010211_41170 [Streptomyces albospinus]|uniref:Uncharacterized protein n=1 Tax=Streptomyces albospinus TaxID=285515 RepID=A0ABQ2V902_9ACTN|nr:hypothetical protein GCM10010211_41170 [Streptomyces albospinus]